LPVFRKPHHVLHFVVDIFVVKMTPYAGVTRLFDDRLGNSDTDLSKPGEWRV
jgi:hypothetical protein